MSWPGDDFCKVRDLDQSLFGAHGGLDRADEGPGLRRHPFRCVFGPFSVGFCWKSLKSDDRNAWKCMEMHEHPSRTSNNMALPVHGFSSSFLPRQVPRAIRCSPAGCCTGTSDAHAKLVGGPSGWRWDRSSGRFRCFSMLFRCFSPFLMVFDDFFFTGSTGPLRYSCHLLPLISILHLCGNTCRIHESIERD